MGDMEGRQLPEKEEAVLSLSVGSPLTWPVTDGVDDFHLLVTDDSDGT